ncbi:MAG: hypothetical protein HYS07_03535 [Chlamydiae bacterium]|nr:hypothetical protein [Chlamydiota bacterium]
MEDIVAIKVKDKVKGVVAFLTWGRVFDRLDPEPLLAAVSHSLVNFGLKKVVEMNVCECLQEVSGHAYFFEALVAMSRKQIPTQGSKYKAWLMTKRKEITRGKEIYYIGYYVGEAGGTFIDSLTQHC